VLTEVQVMMGDYFYHSIIIESLGRKSFSNSFDRTGNKPIALYDSASSAGLPDFWIMMICTTFH